MKRNISFIPLDATLAAWLAAQLENAPPSSPYIRDLAGALREFAAGQPVAILLGSAEEALGLPSTSNEEIHIGELAIYPRSRKVTFGETPVLLTPKEYDILLFLAANRGEVFTKEQIYKAVWEEDFLLADSNMMAFIRKLRKKIEPNPDAPEYILTIWGVGYKLNDQL